MLPASTQIDVYKRQTSRTGSDYRARFLTTGNDYKDTNYSGGSAPTNRAMAQATCGTAGVSKMCIRDSGSRTA